MSVSVSVMVRVVRMGIISSGKACRSVTLELD